MTLLEKLRLATPANAPANGNGTNPRKVAKGTSYVAEGLIPAQHLDDEQGSSQVPALRETVPELASSFQRTQTYARMMTDAGVDVSIRVAKTPVLGAEFFMEPYSDDPNDVLISQFIWGNLMDGMSAPFINAIEDILHFYEDGYAVAEMVFENREWAPRIKGANSRIYTMLKKLAYRPASSIKDIVYDDNGGPVELVQNAIRADKSVDEVSLKIENLIVFTMNRKGGDLTGKSLLRTAYPHWYYKTHFYKIDAIQKERHSLGVPKGKLLPGYNENDKKILRQLLRFLRTNEESFAIETPNVEIQFMEFKGQLPNVLESANHHNLMIMLNVMAQFLVLGVEGQGGGRATAGAQTDMFMKALKHIASYIADCINMYLIPQLVVWNFPTRNFPKLKVRNIGDTRDIQMLMSGISNILAQGGITMDDPLENWIRSTIDAPAMDKSTQRAPAPTDATPAPDKGKGSTKQPRDKVGDNVGAPKTAPR